MSNDDLRKLLYLKPVTIIAFVSRIELKEIKRGPHHKYWRPYYIDGINPVHNIKRLFSRLLFHTIWQE